MSAPETIYDIFFGTIQGDARWLLAVSGIRNAINVMNHLAANHPGAYFVFDGLARSAVAQINTLEERLTA